MGNILTDRWKHLTARELSQRVTLYLSYYDVFEAGRRYFIADTTVYEVYDRGYHIPLIKLWSCEGSIMVPLSLAASLFSKHVKGLSPIEIINNAYEAGIVIKVWKDPNYSEYPSIKFDSKRVSLVGKS